MSLGVLAFPAQVSVCLDSCPWPWLLRGVGAGSWEAPGALQGSPEPVCGQSSAFLPFPEPGIIQSTAEELEMLQKEKKWELGIRHCGCPRHQHQSVGFILIFKADNRDVSVPKVFILSKAETATRAAQVPPAHSRAAKAGAKSHQSTGVKGLSPHLSSLAGRAGAAISGQTSHTGCSSS